MRLSPFSLKRLLRIRHRQDEPGWGPDYVPSILAKRDETSSISRPSVLHSEKLGRDLHFHSIPERMAGLLALYNPAVIDIHEQHMLRCMPGPHPLAGHPLSKGLDLLMVPGTVAVAKQFGRAQMRKHPCVLFSEDERKDPEVDCDQVISFPYIGDFLIVLMDEQGIYVVNWTVKPTQEAFFEPAPHNPLGRLTRQCRRMDTADARHRLEEEYFRQAGVRTVRVAASDFDTAVVANLTDLACQAGRPEPLDFETRAQMIQLYQGLIGKPTTVCANLGEITHDLACSKEDAITVLLQAIWARKIRVDLHRPILMDRPLVRERVDILDEYSNLFRRA